MNEMMAAEGAEPDDYDDKPEPSEARVALVKEITDNVTRAKEHWKDTFDEMRRNQQFVRGFQWEGQTNLLDDRYRVNITLRHIQQSTAMIYAKNPTASAKARKQMYYLIWDEKPETLDAAAKQIAEAQMSGMPPPPQAVELLNEVAAVSAERLRRERLSRTLEIVFNQQINEGVPRLKTRMKQAVRRAKTCKVAYCKLGYQREMGRAPDWQSRMRDHTDRLTRIEELLEKHQEGELDTLTAEAEELRLLIQATESEPEIVLREGLVFGFPRSTAIIVDPDAEQITGFVGARWIAEEFTLTASEIKRIYGVEVCEKAQKYVRGKSGTIDEKKRLGKDKKQNALCCVYEYYDIEAGTVCTICDGHDDFLKEPAPPEIWMEQGHPYFALCFNEIEDEANPFPPAEVENIMPQNRELNRTQEGLRQHRIANRPAWLTAAGTFSREDKDKLGNHATNEVLQLEGIPVSGEVDVRTKIAPKPISPIEPALYDAAPVMRDYLLASGQQQANIGGTSGSTATEAGIAEQSRAGESQSQVDDLDEFLTDLFRAAGQTLFLNMEAETVRRVAGPGAVWPESAQSRRDLADEVLLEVQGGSSGRPNKALELSNMERVAPFLIQTPGISPQWMAKQLIRKSDETVDLSEAIADGAPAIVAMNAASQVSTGNPATDPAQQGAKGGMNTPAPIINQDRGPTPAMPAPTATAVP